jgi:hypothetical protein
MKGETMKLYRYHEDCGRMGSIEGLLFLTQEQLKNYREHSHALYWDELLGKHSEGKFDFSDENLELIDLPEDIIETLYSRLGAVLSGPFDLDYFDEQIEEAKAQESEDDD